MSGRAGIAYLSIKVETQDRSTYFLFLYLLCFLLLWVVRVCLLHVRYPVDSLRRNIGISISPWLLECIFHQGIQVCTFSNLPYSPTVLPWTLKPQVMGTCPAAIFALRNQVGSYVGIGYIIVNYWLGSNISPRLTWTFFFVLRVVHHSIWSWFADVLLGHVSEGGGGEIGEGLAFV